MEKYKHTEEFLWLKDKNYRYVLGQIKKNPLIVIGLNPSTATPSLPDRTYCKILTIANNKKNGFDSIIIFNLYPFITKNPKELPQDCDRKVRKHNLKIIKDITSQMNNLTVLCAWCGSRKEKISKRKHTRNIFFIP